jgi:ribosomal protection tetracycline resistance protein
MGVIQTEILTEVLRTRFGLSATFGKPTVIYKETPSTSGIIGEAYTMPKPCWAIVKYRIEPGPRGSGVSYRSEVGVNDIRKRWQSEIEEGLPGALKQGIKGWEITDLRITLVEGSDHVQHSRPGNWIIATNIAILKGLTTTGSTLLEPILAYRITAPQEYSGKITSDMITMRGTFDPPESMGGSFTLTGRVPLSTSMDYTIRLSSLTGGRAKLSQFFDGYEVCPDGQGVTRDYRGISPLDRSKYILKMRGAITTSVKDD